ncbi:bicd family-like cargo adapter [Anaeramoeba ignava]|uniref:Bicd family-like cargo adapter n=1 Tax=Anaeramoeba ignava TaxID=1746090 RepID=A0A9Q0LTK6_ANAIG|nr:bicd family-like cargo adapter [Anaeramoeba ignava]
MSKSTPISPIQTPIHHNFLTPKKINKESYQKFLDQFWKNGQKSNEITRSQTKTIQNQLQEIEQLLCEREHDLLLAAQIGQSLLQTNYSLESKVENYSILLEKEESKKADLISENNQLFEELKKCENQNHKLEFEINKLRKENKNLTEDHENLFKDFQKMEENQKKFLTQTFAFSEVRKNDLKSYDENYLQKKLMKISRLKSELENAQNENLRLRHQQIQNKELKNKISELEHENQFLSNELSEANMKVKQVQNQVLILRDGSVKKLQYQQLESQFKEVTKSLEALQLSQITLEERINNDMNIIQNQREEISRLERINQEPPLVEERKPILKNSLFSEVRKVHPLKSTLFNQNFLDQTNHVNEKNPDQKNERENNLSILDSNQQTKQFPRSQVSQKLKMSSFDFENRIESEKICSEPNIPKKFQDSKQFFNLENLNQSISQIFQGNDSELFCNFLKRFNKSNIRYLNLRLSNEMKSLQSFSDHFLLLVEKCNSQLDDLIGDCSNFQKKINQNSGGFLIAKLFIENCQSMKDINILASKLYEPVFKKIEKFTHFKRI